MQMRSLTLVSWRLTFSERDHVVGFATRCAGSEAVDCHHTETVDGVGQQSDDLRTGGVGGRDQCVVDVPFTFLSNSATRQKAAEQEEINE